METLNYDFPSTPYSSQPKTPIPQSPNITSPSPSVNRLWRPAAQRNLRNQWSKLSLYKDKWISASSKGRSGATSLVNAHLSQRYVPEMDLGVLSRMPEIRRKASEKLAQQQELYARNILSSYKDMMDVVSRMKDTCGSMRCFLKGPSSSPLVQFCSQPGGVDDNGDGGGVPVFTFLSITCFENLANELVQMFILELSLKRLLVVELLSVNCEEPPQGQIGQLIWSDELYPGEFDDLCSIDLYSVRNCGPLPPRLEGWEFGNRVCKQSNHLPDREVLQEEGLGRRRLPGVILPIQRSSDRGDCYLYILFEVYLTAWLVEVNIDMNRVDQIFGVISEEMHVSFS